MKIKIIGLFAFVLASTSYAQLEQYQFKRKLDAVAKSGYYSIPLKPEIIARCKSNVDDIRLYQLVENDTLELPYLFEWFSTKNEQQAIPFELINDTYNQKCCSYITLKFSKKHPINQIKLDVLQSNFDQSLTVEGSNDNKEWFTIRNHLRIVGFQNANEHFSYTNIDFPSAEYTYFRLKLDDDGSARINITAAYAFETASVKGNYSELEIGTKKQINNEKEKTSEMIVTFPFNYRINYLTIKTNSTADFYRNMNVYASSGTYRTAKGEEENWYLMNTSVFSSKENNPIFCNNESTKKIKIEIINYDNEPIEINEVKAYSEQCQLIANLPISENMYLVYGKANGAAPVYDIEHFREKIPTGLVAVAYGKEVVKIQAIKKSTQLIENKKWLWIVVGAIILIIGYFSLRMLKKEEG
jgi:Protein of unknown function (DUF3999)